MSSQVSNPFFAAKRPWSRIKDRILSAYLAVYLPKVATLGKRILLVDGFAGPGRFEDGSVGSPVLIVEAGETRARGKYHAIFVNKEADEHDALTKLMKPYIDARVVTTVPTKAAELLQELAIAVKDQTLFLYLDPFGLAGCEWEVLVPFLQRTAGSTEILINIQRPEIPRLACANAEARGAITYQVDALQRRLTKVTGSNYWREVFAYPSLTTDEKVTLVVEDYRRRIARYLEFTASCPIREREDGPIKYQMILCSHVVDALEVMNDAACRAYNQHMYEQRVKGTLFEPTNWEDERDLANLAPEIGHVLRRVGPGSRRGLWREFIQEHFMEYQGKEYRKVIGAMIADKVLDWVDVKGTKKLSDDAIVFLPDAPPAIRVDKMIPQIPAVKKPMRKKYPPGVGVPASQTTRVRRADDPPPSMSARPTA
jgi:three-Cys-motif partner protein